MRTIGLSLAGLVLALAAGAAALAMLGRWDGLAGRPLEARVTLSDFALPADYAVDPTIISDDLVLRLQERVDMDFAIRTMLGDQGGAMLREQLLPRLLNAGVIRRMLETLDGLGTVIEMPDYESLARIEVTNRGDAALQDVTLLLPGPGRAEGEDGAPLAPRTLDDGRVALELGPLAAGQAVRLTAWLTAAPEAVAPGEVRLGASGADGTVRLFTRADGWRGADLQVLPWARWTILGVLAALTFAGLALAAMSVLLAMRPARGPA